jgi:hypothetical protein
MRFLQVALVALSIIAVSGCEHRERSGTSGDPHRAWWAQHHQGEAYDRDRGEREHRDWCNRTPDQSCEGWR